MAMIRGSTMYMKTFRSVAKFGLACTAACAATTVLAVQTVTPYSAASGGSAISAANIYAGGTVTFFGRYEVLSGSTGNESGLGLKVKYDKTKFANVVVDLVPQTSPGGTLYTKCMIANPDQQETTPATSQIVFGWIDTSIRTSPSAGAVGWPATSDAVGAGVTSSCLNPGGIVTTQAGTDPTASALSLFKITLTGASAAQFPLGNTTTITLDAEGNYSYAGTTPGFQNKTITLTSVAAPAIALTGAGSRKTHANSGGDKTATIASINGAAVTAAADAGAINGSIESRAGTTTTAVMTFNGTVTSFSGASISSCRRWTGVAAAACTTNPTIGTITVDPANSNQVLIPLTGLVDQSRVQITLTTVNGSTINAQMTIGFLAGDVNNDGLVDGNDVSNVQARVAQGQNINSSATAFRADVNADGLLDGNDAANVSTRVAQGRRLP